jgi:hypothetical protein
MDISSKSQNMKIDLNPVSLRDDGHPKILYEIAF